jgi:hypothetical protein
MFGREAACVGRGDWRRDGQRPKAGGAEEAIGHLPAQIPGEWLERVAFRGGMERDQCPAPAILLRD